LVEAGGIEPDTAEKEEVTTIGQNRPSSSQAPSHPGQGGLVEASAPTADRASSGQAGASAGEKWNVPGASVEVEGLARVIAAWPDLHPALKAAILAIVRSQDGTGPS
jgi:hypothetical protein